MTQIEEIEMHLAGLKEARDTLWEIEEYLEQNGLEIEGFYRASKLVSEARQKLHDVWKRLKSENG